MSPGWIVFICFLALVLLVLLFPVRICLSYSEEGFRCGVKLLFWTLPLFPREKKPETPRQKARREKKEQRKAAKKEQHEAKNKNAKQEQPKKKRTVREWLELIKLLAASGGRAARRFWKGFVIDKLTFHMAVAGADAADTAISYGKMNAQVYTAYAFLMQYVTLKRTDIRIVPDFLSQQSRMEISGELFFRVGTLLASGLHAGWYLLKELLRDRLPSGRKQAAENG